MDPEIETGQDIGGAINAEAMNWWAQAFPQWQGGE